METKKYIIAFDTIVDGEQCFNDEDETPTLYDSREEAVSEMFDDNLSMLESHEQSGQLEDLNDGVTTELVKEMRKVYESGDTAAMEIFLDQNTNCNDIGSWVVPADEFKLGHKIIFKGN